MARKPLFLLLLSVLTLAILAGTNFDPGSASTPDRNSINDLANYPLVEEFDSTSGFTQTDPDVYIADGKVYWTVYRDGGEQYVYRSIPAFTGDVRITVSGQVDSANNNCHVKAGIGDAPGTGAYATYGYFGGGCPVQGYVIGAGGVLLDLDPHNCTSPPDAENWLWVNAGTQYTATLEVAPEASLTVPGVGSVTGTPQYTSEYNTLYVGLTGGGDWPSCSGTIERIVVEPLAPLPDPLFEDDFSTDKGWVDESNGYIYRDSSNEWLVYDTDRGETRRYYIPIDAAADTIALQARFRVTGASGNGKLCMGFAETLDFPGDAWPCVDANGVFTHIGHSGGSSGTMHFFEKYADGTLIYDENPLPLGSLGNWLEMSMVIDNGSWTLSLADDVGNPLGQASGTLSASHNSYPYLWLGLDDLSGWETESGFIDDIVVYGTPAPTTEDKPAVVLVHGFQGLSLTPLDCDPLNLTQVPPEIAHWGDTITDPGMQKAIDYWGEMPGWLDGDYDVWVAQLKTGLLQGTPHLAYNGACLRNQINYVAQQTGRSDILVVAHSMGGLVSRSCLAYGDCRDKTDTLITLGSPHAGLPGAGIANILKIACDWQPGVCDMAFENMVMFNSLVPLQVLNSDQGLSDYYFIGGDGTSGPFHWQRPLWYALGAGPNDGLVGKYSAVGWVWNDGVFDPSSWVDNSPPAQYWTDEFHSTAYSFEDGDPAKPQIRDDYYHLRYEDPLEKSNAYNCFTELLSGNHNPDTCEVAIASIVHNTPNATVSSVSQSTSLLDGIINTGQTITDTLTIDTSGQTIFYTAWHTDSLAISLERPDGQVVDPAYAASHPAEVSYASGNATHETPSYATYSFTNTLPGTWMLVVDATGLAAPSTEFWAFSLLESNRTLEVEIDGYYYQFGDTTTLTASLQSDGVGLAGASVSAEISRSDGNSDMLTLTDQGDGTYTASYVIPNIPGYLNFAIVATGNDGGADFTRQRDLLAVIASQDAEFTGTHNEQGNDTNGDRFFETLDFDTEVSVSNAGNYMISALLVSEDGMLVTNIAVNVSLATGTHIVTLPFNGRDIRAAQIDGPYTITNLQLTEINTGIPSQILGDVFTTRFYNWFEFGADLFFVHLPLTSR